MREISQLFGGLALVMAGLVAAASLAVAQAPPPAAGAQNAANPQSGRRPKTAEEAFASDWRSAQPGALWLIRPKDLPQPFATPSASNGPSNAPWTEGMTPKAPEGFKVSLFAKGLREPRTLKIAPNGDVFLAESGAGNITVFKKEGGAGQAFATGLNRPYGIAFYPPEKPRYLYVAETNRVVRYPYADGAMKATGPAEVIVDKLPTGGHWTRDLAFSPDGTKMYIAVGSASNVGERMGNTPADLKAYEQKNGVGAGWGSEENRAALLVADADGKNLKHYANGIRNCSGLAVEPSTGSPWCATNERDGLGDNVPPDYVTRVQQGGFYGWPWYYIGNHPDPRHKAAPRAELNQYLVTPDILIQAHSAPLGLAFYNAKSFPDEYVGDAFVALHGSWNRGKRTGYKVVRLHFENGQPVGAYEDFLTGFVTSDAAVWGRPVGVAVAADGSLLVSEDGAGTIWRVSRE